VASQGREAVFSGDIVHHPIQCAHPDWASRACIDKDMSNASRQVFLDKYAETDVAIFAAHFATPTAGRIVAGREAFRFDVTD
jgi:glyoxylase-like metal-dependent hydrolase (beta-lactamase superfamily II)